MNLHEEYSENGAVVLKKALRETNFREIDGILKRHWKNYSIDDPYSEECANFAKNNSRVVTSIYAEVANLKECIQIARVESIKSVIQSFIGAEAKIYSKIPLRIDVPLETKELAVWHQDNFYVKGAPNEITAWIPLQDTPMHMGALSVMKKSQHYGQLKHDTVWGKKSMPTGVYDLPVNIIEMQRGDVLLFNSFLLHTSNINFSNLIRYSIQVRFTSKQLGAPSTIMGELNDL